MKTTAIEQLAQRVLPQHCQQIVFTEIADAEGHDVFTVSGVAGRIHIEGNSCLSMATGLGWYLKNVANCNLSWCGSRMDLPEFLPAVPVPHRQIIVQKYRAYMNYCTFNYSASWWDWPRWEQEIDFMALNGINLPLSVVGVEGVWYDMLTGIGFSDEEARAFLCGPAFLAWQWMTNLEGFGGPLPKEWIERRVALGKRILERELQLGMQPIQQGFSGCVPRLLQKKYPDAKIRVGKDWCGFDGTAQLDPTDPLFLTLGTRFLAQQKVLFGSYGFYAMDPFHENKPPEESTAYLNGVGDAIQTLLTNFDPHSVWVSQSWSIRHDIACRMDKTRLLILDLAGKKHTETENFWGYPFVTGSLHNFGGRINLHGDLHRLAANPFQTVRETAPNVCGTGLFMEAIGQNPAYYDLALEMLTRSDRPSLSGWMHAYMARRTGLNTPAVEAVGETLLRTVYSPGTDNVEYSSIVCARPALRVKKSGPNNGFHYPYGNRRLFEALKVLAASGASSDGYCYDVVDLLRQVLSNYGQTLYRETADSFLNRNAALFAEKSKQFLALLSDIDTLLSTRSEFRLDTWLKDARSWGDTPQEKQYYEWNAGVLITLWGSGESTRIFDYGWKEWAGLISGFYRERWSRFFEMLTLCLQSGEEYYEDHLPQVYEREAFRAGAFYNALADWETDWTHREKHFPEHKPDTQKTVTRLIAKYDEII